MTQLVKRISFKTSIAYLKATCGDWYTWNIPRTVSGGKLKRLRAMPSRDVFARAIENIGVHLEVSPSSPSGEDRIKEVICERGCRI